MAGTISWIPNLNTTGTITTGAVIGGGRVRKISTAVNHALQVTEANHIIVARCSTGISPLMTVFLPSSATAYPATTFGEPINNTPPVDGQEFIIISTATYLSAGPYVSASNALIQPKSGAAAYITSPILTVGQSMRLVWSAYAGMWLEL